MTSSKEITTPSKLLAAIKSTIKIAINKQQTR